MQRKRILLVHLISNGDCLMATTIARQIKEDFPGCHLTWAIGYKCRQAIDNNPYVDDIWSVQYTAQELPYDDFWYKTKAVAERRRLAGEFDLVYYTQIVPENCDNFDGTTRTSIFRSYPGRITVPVQPVLRLFEHETAHVRQFAERHELHRYRNVVLFECAPGSYQSFLSPQVALSIANRLVSTRHDTAFILSSLHSFSSANRAVIDGSILSYRENAELSKYCTLLLGCSSGITWLLTSDWAQRLPTIQFLSMTGPWYSFASVKYDHRFLGLDTNHIFETNACTEDGACELLNRYFSRLTFDGLSSFEFAPSDRQIRDLVMMKQGRLNVRRVIRNFTERNRGVPVRAFAIRSLAAYCKLKSAIKTAAPWIIPHVRRISALVAPIAAGSRRRGGTR